MQDQKLHGISRERYYYFQNYKCVLNKITANVTIFQFWHQSNLSHIKSHHFSYLMAAILQIII